MMGKVSVPVRSSLANILTGLARLGCVPGIYRRGNLWRAHVNIAGNFWHDAESPVEAMRVAVRAWMKAGCPLDGMADKVLKEAEPQ